MSEKATTDRRSFLKWAGLGAAGTVAAVAITEPATAEEVNPDGTARYSETAHVKEFYRLAKF